MFISRLASATPLLFAQLLQAISKSDKPIVEIDGYPRHGTKIELLDEKQQRQIKDLAKRIVDSHKTPTPIIAFAVDGHADIDFSVPQAQRRQVEQRVSQDRAEAARNALLSEMIKLDRGSSIAAAMPFVAQGFGSKFVKRTARPGQSLTEPEMRQNRRVEFFIAQFIKPPPQAPVPPAPPVQRIGVKWKIQIKSGLTISTPPLPEPFDNVGGGNTTLFLEITDRDRRLKAKFTANVTGMILPSATVGPPGSGPQTEMITQGDPVEFDTNQPATLAEFEGEVEVIQGPGAGVSKLTVGGNFDFEFNGLARRGIFPKKHPVSVPAGSGAFALPKAGLGFTSKGTLSMTSKPTAEQ